MECTNLAFSFAQWPHMVLQLFFFFFLMDLKKIIKVLKVIFDEKWYAQWGHMYRK